MPMVDFERFSVEEPPPPYLLLRELAMAPHSSADLPGSPDVRRTSGMEAGARRRSALGAAVTSLIATRDKARNERIIMTRSGC